jgi:hypothetical protein
MGHFDKLQAKKAVVNSVECAGQIKELAVQEAGDAAVTVAESTRYLNCNADASSSRVVTMPAALKGSAFRAFWSVEQATSDRVFTRAGSDTFEGNIFTSQAGNAGGDGDVVAIANTTTAITVVDDVNIGSYIDFFCMADGRWSVVGHLVLDAVASVPTLA